jgi:xanthine dehydrogenase accessory factor
MTTWFEAVVRLRATRRAGVLVTVTDVRGHAPRDAGAKMVVASDASWGSIGGGNLEEEAIRRSRELISSGAGAPESFVANLSDKAPFQHGVQCCGGEVSVLMEPLAVVPSVAVFGVGHVGMELARILARHDLDLHLVDSRAEHLSREVLAPLEDAVALVRVHAVPVLPELVIADLPHGTRVLVLTHDHAEDLALVDAALRAPHLGPIGLIGSSAKWTRFRGQLIDAGIEPEVADRVETPIGMPGVTTSKDPAAIAVSVAAALLSTFEREGAVQR